MTVNGTFSVAEFENILFTYFHSSFLLLPPPTIEVVPLDNKTKPSSTDYSRFLATLSQHLAPLLAEEGPVRVEFIFTGNSSNFYTTQLDDIVTNPSTVKDFEQFCRDNGMQISDLVSVIINPETASPSSQSPVPGTPGEAESKSKTGVIVGAVAGAVVGILLMLVGYRVYAGHRQLERQKQNELMFLNAEASSRAGDYHQPLMAA